MHSMLFSLVTICSIAAVAWSLPELRQRGPQSTQSSTAGISLTPSSSQSNVVITTTVASKPYTLTYVPPTKSGTGPASASTTNGWQLIPPIVPLPFVPPPAVPPPEVPEIPTEPGDPDPPNDDDGKKTQISMPTPPTSACSTSTASFGVANCAEVVWVSSNKIQSSLSSCSTSFSTTSGCAITATTGLSTLTINLDTSSITATSDSSISYVYGPVIEDEYPPDNPNLVADIFKDQLHISPPIDPPRGELTCAPQVGTAPSFTWANANSNIMDFCGTGIKITGDGISTNYTSPDDGSIISIVAKYAVNDTCHAGGTTSWDQSRCKFVLNRPLLECEPNGNAIPAPPMYGGAILADCVETTITPFTTQNVVCGAFDNGGGMGFKAFTPATANDAIDKYCNSDTYTADPNRKGAPYGVQINGYAKERFWYKDNTYCLTTAPRPPPPNIPKDQSVCNTGMKDYEIDIGVQFNSDQTGCQPEKMYTVPRGKECSNILQKVVAGCKLDGPDFGGRVEDNSDSGCLQWWLYATGSQL